MNSMDCGMISASRERNVAKLIGAGAQSDSYKLPTDSNGKDLETARFKVLEKSAWNFRMQSMTRKVYLTLIALGSLLFFGLYATSPQRQQSAVADHAAPLSSEGTTAHPLGEPVTIDSSSNGGPNWTTRANHEDEQSVPNVDNLSEVHEKYVLYEDKCRIRSYDPQDPVILKKYFSKEPAMCPSNAKPFVFYPEINSTVGRFCVGIDHVVVNESYGGDVASWECAYRETVRDERKRVIDMYFYFGEKKQLKAGDCPTEEFIWIECKRPGANQIYQQPLMLPSVKSVRGQVRPNNLGEKPFHVLVIGLDAVSRLNAHRQLPKTLEFLKTKEHLVELFGYNKIEDNSMPNQIPLLTGIPYAPPGMRVRLGLNYFDNMTRYLWDHYEERGYRTMYYEEQWNFGLFVYPSTRGFQKVPTTYWPRPMMQAIDGSSLKAEGKKWCIGPNLPAKHYLDYTYNTMKILGENRPMFSYSWLSEAAHDDVNGGHRADRYFLDFFTKMESSGILSKTAVFFISDHGSRIGDFRKSALGRYEDMLPFGFLLLPGKYFEMHGGALKNLRANSKRLVTVYDLHASLLELADPWNESRIIRTANGYSLFSNLIPSDRNCKDAGINFQYCSCYESQPQDKTSALSRSLAEFVVEKLNNLIKRNNAAGKCQEWSLGGVEDFVRLSEGSDWTNFYKATIKTEPAAQFEVAARRDLPNESWHLLSDIDRTDWFSTKAKCVKRRSYEKYCYCK